MDGQQRTGRRRPYESRRPSEKAEAFSALRTTAAGIPAGTGRSGLECPFCYGGQTREKSLSLTRTSEAECLYICHRASCSKAGRLACQGYRLSEQVSIRDYSNSPRREFTPGVWDGDLTKLGEAWLSYLGTTFGLAEREIDRVEWGEDSRNGDLVCPIRDQRNVRTGTETRKPTWKPLELDQRTKTKNYFNVDVPRLSWFSMVSGETTDLPLVLVEDSISALRVSRQFPAVSLLGSHINMERLEPCLETRRTIVIALDPDATFKAFKFQKQFNLYGDLRVAVLDRDLKYGPDERIKELIEHAIN